MASNPAQTVLSLAKACNTNNQANVSKLSIVESNTDLYVGNKKLSNQDQVKSSSASEYSSVQSSRRNSFQKSNLSPTKTVGKHLVTTAIIVPNQSSKEDIEMVSCASSSSASSSKCSSNKENNSLANDVSSSNEPSKLSISEKMKLFSGNKVSSNETNLAVVNSNHRVKSSTSNCSSSNKLGLNRFQTQVALIFSKSLN